MSLTPSHRPSSHLPFLPRLTSLVIYRIGRRTLDDARESLVKHLALVSPTPASLAISEPPTAGDGTGIIEELEANGETQKTVVEVNPFSAYQCTCSTGSMEGLNHNRILTCCMFRFSSDSLPSRTSNSIVAVQSLALPL